MYKATEIQLEYYFVLYSETDSTITYYIMELSWINGLNRIYVHPLVEVWLFALDYITFGEAEREMDWEISALCNLENSASLSVGWLQMWIENGKLEFRKPCWPLKGLFQGSGLLVLCSNICHEVIWRQRGKWTAQKWSHFILLCGLLQTR